MCRVPGSVRYATLLSPLNISWLSRRFAIIVQQPSQRVSVVWNRQSSTRARECCAVLQVLRICIPDLSGGDDCRDGSCPWDGKFYFCLQGMYVLIRGCMCGFRVIGVLYVWVSCCMMGRVYVSCSVWVVVCLCRWFICVFVFRSLLGKFDCTFCGE